MTDRRCQSYVISRSTETPRFIHMKNSLIALGQNPCPVPAFYLTPEEAALEHLGVSFGDNPMTTGERGCFLSHVLAWKMLMESGEECAFVYEDDVLFSADSGPVLSALAGAPLNFDIIRVEATRQKSILSRRGATVMPGYRLHDYYDAAVCSGGYLLTRECDARLITLARSTTLRPLDIWLFYRAHMPDRRMRYGTLEPAACIQFDQLCRRGDLPMAWSGCEPFAFLGSTMDRSPGTPRPAPLSRALGNFGREVSNLFLGRTWKRIALSDAGPLTPAEPI